jgi:hypothetical protein
VDDEQAEDDQRGDGQDRNAGVQARSVNHTEATVAARVLIRGTD